MESDKDTEVLTDIYHALRVPRRCYVVRLLMQSQEESYSTRALAERIAAIEKEIPVEHVSGSPYRNVYNSLSQSHLPSLAEADLIIYDPQRQTVKKGPRFQLAALVLSISQATYQTLTE